MFKTCARKLYILKGNKPDDFSKKTCLFITCLVLFIILEDLMLDVECNAIYRCGKNIVLKLHILLLYMDREIEYRPCSYHHFLISISI